MSEPSHPPSEIFKPPERLIAEPLLWTYQAWRELSGDRFAPSRKEIDPARFKPVLASIFLVEVLDDGADFCFVIAGERIVQFMGQRLRGKLMSSLPPSPFFERMSYLYRQCVQTKRSIAVGPIRTLRDGREYRELEVVVMPLSDTGVSVTSILGAVHLSPLREG